MTDLLNRGQLDAQAERLARSTGRKLDRLPLDAWSPQEVVEFARAAGYAVDAGLLRRLSDLGRIPEPYLGRYTLAAVGHCLAYCEQLRLWLPDSPRHIDKWSPFEREVRDRVAAGLPPVEGLDALPVRGLVLMLTNTPDPVARQAVGVALLAKLDALGVDAHQ